ncbi:FAD-dependent oxidoreductase [Actinophytocola sp.]|uniref:oxidoreductase n=1 Tax=Actinophytocola sp. TaxID=1872138 RepID=UPI003D6BF465
MPAYTSEPTVVTTGLPGVARFPNLLSPTEIGPVDLANRVVMLPMGLRFTRSGTVTDDDVAFYRARAAAGVGLIVMGGTVAHPGSVGRGHGQREAFRPDNVPAFARLADEVHRHHTKLFGQLLHVGDEWLGDSEFPPVAPSALRRSAANHPPHALTADEIDDIVDGFATSAENLLAAGFDGIELHAAHGYLIGQFLSPARNRRTDRYGGSAAARATFAIEIAEAVRSRCGGSFALGVRLSGTEEIPDGIDLDESTATARILAATGMFDYVSVAVGVRGAYVKDMSHPRAAWGGLARAIRDASGLPVIASQRITRPRDAEAILANGDADLIGMARQLIADPAWVHKVRSGHVDRILPCVGCLQDCRSNPGGVTCMHNPVSGRELDLGTASPARGQRTVTVVGGGPAGLETARICAERGHDVVLYERAATLGGQVALASRAPHRNELAGVIGFRSAELARLGVEVRLGVTVTAATIAADGPDAVVVATGAEPAPVTVPVADGARVLDVWTLLGDVTRSDLRGRPAVVVDDGSGRWEAYNAAEFLAERGAAVTLVTPATAVGAGLPVESLPPLLRRLHAHGVEFAVMTAVSRIEERCVHTVDAFAEPGRPSRAARSRPAHITVVAGPSRSVDRLFVELRRQRTAVYAVGDCVAPRRISHAVLEGHRVAAQL